MDPDPTERNTFWTVVLGNIAIWLIFVAIEPAGVQRFLAVPTLRNARECLVIFTVLTIITKLISSFFGLIIYAKYFDCDPLSAGHIKKPDQILPYYVLQVSSVIPGLSGLFVAGLFSTALSALSTYLNALSGIIYKDLIAPFMPTNTSEEKASNLMKMITIVLGILSVLLIFIVEKLGTILELLFVLKGTTTGPILGIFTMGMLFPFANKKGAFYGAVGSIVVLVIIVVQNQIYIWNGAIRYTRKPMDISGCNATSTFLNYTTSTHVYLTNASISERSLEEPLWLFRISFYYIMLLGALMTIIIGLPISLIARNKEENSFVNTNLLSPYVRCFVSKSDSAEIKLHSLEVNKSHADITDDAVNTLLK